jgi:hypothetical protein
MANPTPSKNKTTTPTPTPRKRGAEFSGGVSAAAQFGAGIPYVGPPTTVGGTFSGGVPYTPTMTPQQWATQQNPTTAPTWATTAAPTATPSAVSPTPTASPSSQGLPAIMRGGQAAPSAFTGPVTPYPLPKDADTMWSWYQGVMDQLLKDQKAREDLNNSAPGLFAKATTKKTHQEQAAALDLSIATGQAHIADMIQEQPWLREASGWRYGTGAKTVQEEAANRSYLAKKYPILESGGTFGMTPEEKKTLLPTSITDSLGNVIEMNEEQAGKYVSGVIRQALGEPTAFQQEEFQYTKSQDAAQNARLAKNDATSLEYQNRQFAAQQAQNAADNAYRERQFAASQAAQGFSQAMEQQRLREQAWQDQMQYALPAGPGYQPGWQPGGPVAQLSALAGASFTPTLQTPPQNPIMPQAPPDPAAAQAYIAQAIAKFGQQ